LDYENSKNPFRERKEQIAKWRMYAVEDIAENEEVLDIAKILQGHRIKNIDSLHIASAIKAGADYFLTTDAGILKKGMLVQRIRITDPIGFIREVLP
jgi:predicted nucleic acid-binding protein